MQTVIMTFVQATYFLATFVHISIISAVTEPILTKLFGPNLLGALILVDKNSCLDQTSFDQKYFLDQICFLTLISGPNSFLT